MEVEPRYKLLEHCNTAYTAYTVYTAFTAYESTSAYAYNLHVVPCTSKIYVAHDRLQ